MSDLEPDSERRPPEPPPLLPVGPEPCARHPNVATAVHCTRCSRPICPDCMLPAPVGYQCPDCVEQAREEFRRSGAGPQPVTVTRGTPATTLLLGLIVAAFLLQILTRAGNPLGESAVAWGAAVPFLIASGDFYRLITAIFLHAGIFHLLLNGYGLYLFGSFIERVFGSALLLALFFATGFVASATSYALAPTSMLGVPGIGASGAVFGLFGAFLAYNFRRRGQSWNRALLLQGLFWLGINVLLSLQPGIDWRAHFGGLVAGFGGGFLLEAGDPNTRRGLSVLTIAGLVIAGIALTAWKTAHLRSVLQSLIPM